MSHSDLLARLLPPTSYTPSAALINAELVAEGAALDGAHAAAAGVLGGVTPFFAKELLGDWERMCDLSPSAGAPYQVRLQAVLAKLAETGGLSMSYFVGLAKGIGYTITIDEPHPFRAGSSRSGQRLAAFDIIWVWRVNVSGGATRAYRFRAGMSRAGERLTYAADPVIKSVFNELKPAHTLAVFTYQE
ncbi:YmfQ family protein [Cupriavidus sp. BIC8F]|uniref:YmfQ family protein n=1 Tax=Cupriavidus sp. BIC8F TaxID=3079014 RepID=UPI0029168814|nr:putative phage tail protein [Cupriavidus sp. BIC8F]